MSTAIALIAGLGNPGQQYHRNRHNAGAIFLSALCELQKVALKPEKKFHGQTATTKIDGSEIRLLFPSTYMNNSGQAVAALAAYYKIAPANILVAYDELDLPLGTARLKFGGGHGGHNGIRDIITTLGTPDFLRLRLGIGHPGEASKVLGHVLGDFAKAEQPQVDEMFTRALQVLPLLVAGKREIAMQQLHTPPSP
jgi:peptidyl-tRNA hydrolase, PTH1 family